METDTLHSVIVHHTCHDYCLLLDGIVSHIVKCIGIQLRYMCLCAFVWVALTTIGRIWVFSVFKRHGVKITMLSTQDDWALIKHLYYTYTLICLTIIYTASFNAFIKRSIWIPAGTNIFYTVVWSIPISGSDKPLEEMSSIAKGLLLKMPDPVPATPSPANLNCCEGVSEKGNCSGNQIHEHSGLCET